MKFFDLSLEFQEFKHTYKDLFDYRECRYDVKKPTYAHVADAFDSDVLSASFLRPQVVMYCEYIATDYLLAIQKKIEQQACNAENICLVTNHTLGCSDWWESYKRLHGIKSYKIIEAPWMWVCHSYFLSKVPADTMTKNFWTKQRKIDQLFCFYGGTWKGWQERQYLILKLMDYSAHGIVDFVGQFESRKMIEDYTEKATCFVNQREVEHILDLYDRYVDENSRLKKIEHVAPDEPLTWAGFRWANQIPDLSKGFVNEINHKTVTELDAVIPDILLNLNDSQLNTWNTSRHCLAHVVRETRGWDQFCTVTEKSLRTFMHHMVYLPTSGVNNTDYIEQLGFKLPTGLVDYAYTKEYHYATRIQKLCDQIDSVKHLTPDDLTQYYLENFDYFQYNFEYIVSRQLFLNIQKQLKEDFERFLFKDTLC